VGRPSWCFAAGVDLTTRLGRAIAGRPRLAQITRLEQVLALLCTVGTLIAVCIFKRRRYESFQNK
jgi:hypothetical protein